MILAKAQAEALYSAMVALNNISGKMDALFALPGDNAGQVHAHENIITGEVHIRLINCDDGEKRELYTSQHSFAEAYGVN